MADMNSLMNSDLYKPNSHKSKKEAKELPPKNVQKVVNGGVKSKEQPLAKKMAHSFVPDDRANIKSYITLDVLIPTIKEAISQIIKNGSDMLIFGDVKPTRSSGRGGFNYNGITKSSTVQHRTVNRRATHDFRDVTFETRSDAMEVLSQMNELIENYGNATVEDFYTFIGEGKMAKYTDRKWGWTDLEGRNIERVLGGGYMIDLPPAEALE